MFPARVSIVLFLTVIAFGAEPASMDLRLAALKKSPPELYAFLYRMPKGGDLHNHLSGAIYAETFLDSAIEERLCVDKATLALASRPSPDAACPASQTDVVSIRTDNGLRNALIDSFSMRNF